MLSFDIIIDTRNVVLCPSEALRQDINKGLDSLEREGNKPLDVAAIKAKGRAKLSGNAR